MTTEAKLPEKKSELIRLAIADLEKCEADPRYEINMRHWHKPLGDVCIVCLAGAVIAKTFQADPETYQLPYDLGNENDKKLTFLDDLRYYIPNELKIQKKIIHEIPAENRSIYEEDREQFKKNMLQIADWYEEIGE